MRLVQPASVIVPEISRDPSPTNISPDTYFAFDSTALDTDARWNLDKQARWLAIYPEVAGLELEGHANDRGNAAYNLALGARRAKAVRDYLIGKGVDPKRLRIVSAGKDRPVAAGHTHDARAKNRVVISKPFGKNVSLRENAAGSAGL